MAEDIILPVIIILFLATLVRVILGFGEALISVPLLALIMPVEQAAPIAVLVSITIALIILVKDWRKVHFRSAGWLIVSTLFGIPVGLLLLKTVPEASVKAILGMVIVAFSVHAFRSRRRYVLRNDRFAWLFGFQAGVLGGAYGMNGPPLAIYGSTTGIGSRFRNLPRPGCFLAAYPSLCLDAAKRLRGLYNPADYPPVDEVAREFGFCWQYVSFGVPDQLKGISQEVWEQECEKAAQRMAEASCEIQHVLRVDGKARPAHGRPAQR
jgi:hypothetical protein